MDERAIGVFDSGLGGLTAAKVLEELLPCEDIIYFGDSGRMPYGGRSVPELRKMAAQDAGFVSSFGVKAMLVACGTMSACAMDALRDSFDVPVFSVENAACDAAVNATRTGCIGIIATEGSIKSAMFEKGIKRRDGGIRVIAKACPSLAGLVEHGHFRAGDPVAEAAVKYELEVFDGSNIDTLLLGCTHYPLLSDIIEACLGKNVRQISCGAEAARELAAYLKAGGSLSSDTPGRRRWFTSGDTELFAAGARDFLGHPIDAEQHIL